MAAKKITQEKSWWAKTKHARTIACTRHTYKPNKKITPFVLAAELLLLLPLIQSPSDQHPALTLSMQTISLVCPGLNQQKTHETSVLRAHFQVRKYNSRVARVNFMVYISALRMISQRRGRHTLANSTRCARGRERISVHKRRENKQTLAPLTRREGNIEAADFRGHRTDKAEVCSSHLLSAVGRMNLVSASLNSGIELDQPSACGGRRTTFRNTKKKINKTTGEGIPIRVCQAE